MAYTSVKIAADAGSYKSEMKSAAARMRELTSEYALAATKAKLFGSETDSLKAKAESLTKKVEVQKTVVKLNAEQHEKLSAKLSDQKNKQAELTGKVEAARRAYEESTEATGKNSEQSKALKDELDKLEQEFRANESAIGKTESALASQTEKVNKAEKALVEMESELNDVNKQLKNHNLDVFANACQTAGEKVEGFGKKMLPVTAGVAAVSAASIQSFTDLKSGYDTIVTKTGATGDSLSGLKDSANNLFGSMPEDMSIVGEAIGEVNTRFHSTGTELEDLSKQFVQFASINGTQITSSVDQVDKIMKAWNIDSSQTKNLLGLLTAKAQETGISVDKLESYVLDNNSAFKEMGLSLPQAINLMAQFDENGVDTTTALSGLKKALQNATAEGKTLDIALEETIGGVKDAETDVEALQIATELFGKKGAAEMAAAIRENRIDLTSLSTSMGEYGSVVEETYNGTKSPLDEAKTAMNNTKLALGELADTALTGAAPIIKDLTDKIKELTSWFTNLDEGQQQTIIKVGLVTAAVGPAAIGFGKVAKGISTTIKTGQQFVSGVTGIIAKITAKTAATTAGAAADAAGTAAEAAHAAATTTATATTGGMTVAQTALNAVMNLCPIILIVTLIAGLIAAGIALYKNWDTVKEKLSEFWAKIKEIFNKIKEVISGAFSKAKEAVTNKVNEIKDKILDTPLGKAAEKTFNTVKDTASKIMGAAVETTKQNLSNMKNAYEENGGGIKGVVAAGMEGIKGAYTSGFTFMDNLTGGKLTELKDSFTDKLKGIKDSVSNSKIGQAVQNEFTRVKDNISKLTGAAVDTAKQNLSNMKNAYEENGGGIKGVVAAGMEGIKGAYTSGFTFMDNLTGGKLTELKDSFTNKLKGIKDSVANSKIGQAVQNEFTRVKDNISKLTGAAVDTAKQNLSNMKNAYEENGGGIKGVVAAGWEGIQGTYKSGFTFIDNLTGGKLTELKNSFSDKFSEIKSNVQDKISETKKTVESNVEKIKDKGISTFNTLKSKVKTTWNAIKEAIEEPIKKAQKTVSDIINKVKDAFNFEWSLPKLKMPHFQITGGFSLTPPSVPKFSVEWYKTGAIMTKPTIFGANGNTLRCGGEAGAEAILPLEPFYQRLERVLDEKLSRLSMNYTIVSGGDSQDVIVERLRAIEDKLEKFKITEILELVPDERRLFKMIRREALKEKEATGNDLYGRM